MPRTRDGAPPCSGPDIAPTAPDSAAATSAPVDAMTRAVNVEAFMPCSAADVQYASTAFTCFGSGSPRQRIMNRSTTDSRLVDLALRNHRQPLPARRLGDVRQRHHGGPRQIVARGLLVDVEQRLQTPHRREHRQRGLHVDPDVTGVDRDRERLGGRQTGVERPVDQQTPHVPERHMTDEILDVDARGSGANRPPCRVRRSPSRTRRLPRARVRSRTSGGSLESAAVRRPHWPAPNDTGGSPTTPGKAVTSGGDSGPAKI